MHQKGMLSVHYLVEITLGVFLLSVGLFLLVLWVGLGTETAQITFLEPVSFKAEITNPKIIADDLVKIKDMPPAVKECAVDFSCEHYFIYVPLDFWDSDALFEEEVKIRANFFKDISPLKFKKVGTIAVPLAFAKACHMSRIRPTLASDHLIIKRCADGYAAALGIQYEKAIGFSSLYDGGRTFFSSKVAYASRGYTLAGMKEEAQSLVAHELGHTYDLCDEYSYRIHLQQESYTRRKGCANPFPETCSRQEELCPGATPTFRDYHGLPLDQVCQGETHYSVMGAHTGAECGYSAHGGYLEIGVSK